MTSLTPEGNVSKKTNKSGPPFSMIRYSLELVCMASLNPIMWSLFNSFRFSISLFIPIRFFKLDILSFVNILIAHSAFENFSLQDLTTAY